MGSSHPCYETDSWWHGMAQVRKMLGTCAVTNN